MENTKAAFPGVVYNNKEGYSFQEGLTIREHFAAIAMQGLLSKYNLSNPQDQQTVTDLSVQLADSLINSLKKIS